MESTCALCGVCICWESPERWLREFRAVYTHNRNWSDIKLSGVSIATEESFTAICPEDSDRKHDDEDLADDDTLYIGLGSANLRTRSTSGLQPLEFTGFGIHSACWNLLTRLFQPDLQLLFHACLSMPIGPRDTVDWGHDYNGAAFYSKGPVPEIDSYDPGTLARREDAAIFRSDPFDIPTLQRALKSIYQLESLSPPLDPPENKSDIFNSLPTEILHFIITSLLSTDVKHLREASRTFATLDLPEMFWSSRFGRGHEFHYVFESLANHPKSWRAFYIMLRMLDLSVPAFQNRRRVWSLALRLQSLHNQMIGVPCQGQSRATFFEPEGISSEDQQQWSTAGRAVRPPTTTPFNFGCLPLRSRQVTWYISGLRFVKEQGRDDFSGYIHPTTEEPICLPQPAEIREWCFGVDLRGIKAISLKTESGWNSPWVGELGTLPIHHQSTPRHLYVMRADFDTLKLVSISFEVQPDQDRQTLYRDAIF
uniref:F-box domain-containing protein n=1 Tax=Bionectria ochroleuca TaxID=29856 RepID=A0A0B7JWK1_BIOOC